MDGARPRTATDLELKYNFGRTFAEVYGLATDAQKAAEEAKMAIEGLDHEEIFNRLTNYGEWQGIYRDANGDVYLNASYIKIGALNGELIQSDSITADALHLNGLMSVYTTVLLYDELGNPLLDEEGNQEYVEDVGGYLGYDNGYNSTKGIGIRINLDGLGSQCVCTDAAVRISYGTKSTISQVVCNEESVLVEGYKMLTLNTGGQDRLVLDVLGNVYPAQANMTLGMPSSQWKYIYAAGTSFSALVARVEALEK
jgi:hypothetical protein